MIFRLLPAALLAVGVAPAIAEQHQQRAASAEVMNTDGEAIGTVSVDRTASGTSLVVIDLDGLPEGVHGMHLHETGDCSADDFSSAGGHIPGDAEHGILAEGGPHPGDLPNTTTASDGTVTVEFFVPDLDIDAQILDDDGAAFIVHSGADDYMSQPSGESGDRIACGVLEAG